MMTQTNTLRSLGSYVVALLFLICLLMSEGRGFAQGIPPGAGERILFTQLSGAAIDGTAPGGKAEFTALQGQTSLVIGASNINLPNGTTLTVALDGKVVGSMVVLFGNAEQLPFT